MIASNSSSPPPPLCVCVFTGIRTVQYDRIMRWWSFNLGKESLQSYTLSLVIKNYYSPARPTCLIRFSGSYYRPPPSYRPPISSISHRHLTLCTPAPHLLSRSGTSSTWTFPTPATYQPPPLVSAPRATCLIMPPYPASALPPLPSSACAQTPVGP